MNDKERVIQICNIRLRIKSYLGNGGLFNPECMDHDKVRALILDIDEVLKPMVELHINADETPSPETVELLSRAALQIKERRQFRYRWWRFWGNLCEYPPDRISVAGLLITIVILVWGLWTGEFWR